MTGPTIRQATATDYFSTENLTRESFWNLYKPGCDEHLMLHNLRKSNCYIAELDFVAISESKDLAGHSICTRAVIKDEHAEFNDVICLGPIGVHTSMQSRGIGSKLVDHSISTAKELGYVAIIVLGDPKYYQRFGFENAREYNVTTRDGQNFDPFMIYVLDKEKMSSIKGAFYEADAFTVDEKELEEFDKKFPVKEKGEAKIKI